MPTESKQYFMQLDSHGNFVAWFQKIKLKMTGVYRDVYKRQDYGYSK